MCSSHWGKVILISIPQLSGSVMRSVNVTLKSCPPGRVLSRLAHNDGLFACDCDRDNEHILSCEPNGFDVVLKVCTVCSIVMFVEIH